MYRLYTLFYLICCGAVVISCVKPYDAESFDFESAIVVDGLITDELKVHQVKLNYTYPIGTSEDRPMTGATVWVTDEENQIDFVEQSPGVYSSEVPFSASELKSYQLFFTTQEGEEFLSSPSSLIKSPPIDSIYDRYAELALDGASSNLGGIQFFLDTHDPSDNAKYFRYEWEDQYRILTPLTSSFIYDRTTATYSPRDKLLNVCYAGNVSKSLLIGSTVGNVSDRLVEFPIRFVGGDTDVLRSKYTILVKQYAISESAYSYYRKLKESIEGGGSLFDKQQGSIVGNITAKNDLNQTVLGYFEVSGVNSLRAYFASYELDSQFSLPRFRYVCSGEGMVNTTEDSVVFYMTANPGLQIVDVNLLSDPQATMGPGYCMDCSLYASPVKPDYWID